MPPHYSTWFVAGGVTTLLGLVSLTGGVLGYIRKGSKPSLIAGGISGVLLIACTFGDWFELWYAAVGAIVISVLLVGRFAGTLAKEKRLSGGMTGTVLGRVAVAIVILGVCTIVLNVIALLV